ncbi:MAG: LysM peptidoglycan-binding domain-containing protein [Calditrichia bacterium]|nr:LysM peptidoglycan-binding domain-containing protein [Calditrichia bacterium]
MKTLMGIVMLTILGLACSSSQKIQTEQESVQKLEYKGSMTDSIEIARSYIGLGLNAEQMGDSSNADYYFQKAMDIAAGNQNEGEVKGDSLTLRMLAEISLAYSKYLARINGIEGDTLTAANVLEILNQIDETATAQDSDSVAVTIQDVIEEDQILTIPLILNKKVENAIQYFQGRGRRVFTKWLQRTGWYRDLIIPILKEEGVPEELFYLAMIESGFNPNARSYARAVGIWQFIGGTGKAYGLNRSWWYDERRDPEKSTRAAAKHLKDLYERFDNWYLAMAGYNYSPAKIERRMRKYNVVEFWDLPRLPRQTRNYVPTFIAAVHIAKNPEKYGFYVEPDSPIVYDTVLVRECVDLNVVANCVNINFNKIKKLNPGLLRWCTPPDLDEWILNIPKGTRENFLKNYAKVPDDKKFTYINHRIRRGETLSEISRKYGVSIAEIKRFNRIRGTMIRAGHYLVIPYPQNKQYARELARRSARKPTSNSYRRKPVKNVPGKNKYVHVVTKGQTLWDISNLYGVSITEIRRWNGLSSSRIIYPEQQINIWLPEKAQQIARVETPQNSASPPSDNRQSESKSQQTVIYTVKRGDTLWDIASEFSVSIRDIKRWNNRQSNLIKPGDQLKIITGP